jgi:AcrR family transcriptional regulator
LIRGAAVARAGGKTTVGERHGRTSRDTRARLISAANEALREKGFFGATAREIARRARCNQALVFYHFGSVGNLLLAALDDVSARRFDHYRAVLEDSEGISGILQLAELVFREDLDAGYLTVLAEMINAASSTPGLGPEVAARIAPWRQFAADGLRRGLTEVGLPELVEADDVGHALVALFLGLELLAHLDGDRTRAIHLFEGAQKLIELFAPFNVQQPGKEHT